MRTSTSRQGKAPTECALCRGSPTCRYLHQPPTTALHGMRACAATAAWVARATSSLRPALRPWGAARPVAARPMAATSRGAPTRLHPLPRRAMHTSVTSAATPDPAPHPAAAKGIEVATPAIGLHLGKDGGVPAGLKAVGQLSKLASIVKRWVARWTHGLIGAGDHVMMAGAWLARRVGPAGCGCSWGLVSSLPTQLSVPLHSQLTKVVAGPASHRSLCAGPCLKPILHAGCWPKAPNTHQHPAASGRVPCSLWDLSKANPTLQKRLLEHAAQPRFLLRLYDVLIQTGISPTLGDLLAGRVPPVPTQDHVQLAALEAGLRQHQKYALWAYTQGRECATPFVRRSLHVLPAACSHCCAAEVWQARQHGGVGR